MNSGILWLLVASFFGFGIAAIFAGWLKLKRDIYLLFYIPIIAVLFYFFIVSNDLNVKELLIHNWYWGLLGALISGAFVIKNVFSQPSSPRSTGTSLVSDIIWPGLTYGLIDSLLLSILPIIAIRLTLTNEIWTSGLLGRIGLGTIALIASFFATTVYHLGYPEFRGKNVIWPNVGNGVLSLAYLLTMNPLAAILPHMAMHVAAMIHGPKTTGQVPPHYKDSAE
jgi:hypothetical protein